MLPHSSGDENPPTPFVAEPLTSTAKFRGPDRYFMVDKFGRLVCPECGKRYVRRSVYGRHLRRVHGIEPTTGRRWFPIELQVSGERFEIRFLRGELALRVDAGT